MPKKLLQFLLCLCTLLAARTFAAEHAPEVEILQAGVRLTLVAEQPDLVTPIGVDVDQEGRVWVVSSHTHFPPDDYEGPEFDEILVFGKDGERSVFYNATYHTMDLELGPDGWIYLAERDRILRVKDTDGDGLGDKEETILVLTSESVYPHNGLSNMAWYPNGDLLFGVGENFGRPWTLTGTGDNEFHGTGEGGVFRCRADGRELQRIARGIWNPFGLCVRQDNEVFMVDNDPTERPPCRLLHIVEGGDYGFQKAYGTEAHHPFVGWYGQLRGTLPMVHPVGEAPSGVTPLGRGLIVTSWSDHRVYFHALHPKGASFAGNRIELARGSRYFRPTCIALDRSNSDEANMTWYLTDWVDGRYEVHGFGRLWKLQVELPLAKWIGPTDLEPPSTQAQLASDLRLGRKQVSQDELLKLTHSADPFIVQAALTSLARLAPNWLPDDIKALTAHDRVQAVLALKIADMSELGTDLPPIAFEPWIELLLTDSDSDVRFETLRWIADSRQTDFLPSVEKLLKRSDLSYQLFEAAIATWNTLSGHPEAGVRNVEMLLDRVQDSSSSPSIRAFALRLLPQLPLSASETDAPVEQEFPEGLTIDLLRDLLEVGDSELSLEVVRTLAGSPSAGQTVLAELAADTSCSVQIRTESLVGLSAVADTQLDLLIGLGHTDLQPVREEALRALRGRVLSEQHRDDLHKVAIDYPESADLIHALLEPQSLTQGRPDRMDTVGWFDRLEAIPGSPDPECGSRIFSHPRIASCASCHRYNGRGNVVGPDLSDIARKGDRKWLITSLLQPSLQMAPEYRPTMVLLDSGRAMTGIRLQSATFEVLRDSSGQTHRFERDEIEMISELDQSFMPEGLVDTLTDREIRDLIEFLSPNPDAQQELSRTD